MLKVIESKNVIMPFDINNPGRNTEEYITVKVGKVSGHDYQKFEKGRDSKIVYMTADEYINECIDNIFHSNYESVVNAVDTTTVYKYMFDMKHGDIFPLPYLNYVNHNQEGRHRMLAFKLLNGKDAKAPVLTIFETKVSEDEIREYCKKKWGESDLSYWINYIKEGLGMIEEENNEDDVEDNEVYLDNIEDDSDEIIKMICDAEGMTEDDLDKLSPIAFQKLINKYL